MKNIRVNIRDNDGNRTTTTINAQIATTWGMYHNVPYVVINDDYRKRLTQAIQTYMNTLKGLDKSEIEGLLMQDIERKIVEREQQKNRQTNLL